MPDNVTQDRDTDMTAEAGNTVEEKEMAADSAKDAPDAGMDRAANREQRAKSKKKKKRRRVIDKEKVAANKKKAKAKKQRLKKQLKEEKARIRAERRKGKVLEEAVKMEESVTVNEEGTVERTITVEETYTIAEKPEEPKEVRRKKKKKILAISGAAAAVVILVGTGSFFGIRNYLTKQAQESAAVEAMVHTEAVELAEYSLRQHRKDHVKQNAGKDTAEALLDATRFLIGGVHNRPPEIELTEANSSDFIKIEDCLINAETGKVDVTMSAEGLAVSDDGYYYLFEEKTYDTALRSDEYIIEQEKDVNLTFSVNLNYNTANSRLCSKFVVAVKKDGEYMPISQPGYITNPEAIAKYSPSFGNTTSKKGLLVDPEKLRTPELDDLGVKHAAYNIPLSRILGNTSNAYYPTVYYTYNGRSYAFNGQIIAEYDYIFTTLTNKGITTTAIILNDIHPGYMELIHPKARSGGHAPYYAFNATDEDGTEYIAAIGSFLANRYSGSGHGKVMNWVIGNEINARREWNYIEYMDTENYVNEYAKAFRIFYNSIVSVNGNARVYISLDQQWGKSLYSNNGYSSKEILDEFNRNIKAGGNIDWGVAYHPYNYPLTSAKAWSTSGKAGSYVLESETSPVITIKNIHVLTDYLQKDEYLTDSGEVRHVILSEMGYTSSAGQDLQAASFVYAYKIIEANRYIDSMLFSRQTDASSEVAQGLALGINTLGGGRKSIYTAFKYVDTAESAKYTDFALRVIGISNWSEVIKQH